MKILRPILLLSVSLLLVSCDDDPTRTEERPDGATLEGSLYAVEDGSPLEDLQVILIERVTLRPVDTLRSAADGTFSFTSIAPGDYLPVVLSRDRKVFHLPQPKWSFTDIETLQAHIGLEPVEPMTDNGIRLRGTVVDADTGEPIPLARVEMNFLGDGVNWSEFEGRATPLEPVSDENGEFVMEPIPLFFDYNQQLDITSSWRVTADGYRARTYKEGEASNFPRTITVRLTAGVDPGVIVGVVIDLEGNRVAGIPVAAEWRRGKGSFLKGPDAEAPTTGKRVILPGGPAITDSEGRYRLEGLPEGAFVIRAGIYGDDGFVGTSASGVEISALEPQVSAPILLAAPAVGHIGPENAAILHDAPLLQWEAVSGAVTYLLSVRRASDGNGRNYSLQNNELQLVPDVGFVNGPDLFTWWIIGFDADGGEISRSDRADGFFFDPTL